MRKNKDKTVGYGYVGRWSDGSIGWCLPVHLSGGSEKYPEPPSEFAKSHAEGEYFERCRITVEFLKGRNKRHIK